MMTWLWRAPGVMTAVMLMGIAMVFTARKVGVNSPHFWWSLLIFLLVAALALTFRCWCERHSGSTGQHPKNQQSCGPN